MLHFLLKKNFRNYLRRYWQYSETTCPMRETWSIDVVLSALSQNGRYGQENRSSVQVSPKEGNVLEKNTVM